MASDKHSLKLRDPIHGLFPFCEVEERVINSQPLQRLRGIHQLAMASLGYPGAVHTRFDHSLGSMHVAGCMFDAVMARLRPKQRRTVLGEWRLEEARRRVRLAALLHDVGHGPFSHASEAALNEASAGPAAEADLDVSKLHELITQDIIANSDGLAAVLDDGDRQAVLQLLDPRPRRRSALRDIVSGALDADKLDYLLRDSYFAGVRYGIVDLDRILESLTARVAQDETYLAITEDGVLPVEQLLLAKYHMTLQVYRHKIRRVTDALLRRALLLACDPAEGSGQVRAVFSYVPKASNPDGNRAFVREFLKWDDARTLRAIQELGPKSRAGKIARALASRDLPREVFHEPFDSRKHHFGPLLAAKFDRPDSEAVLRLQNEVAAALAQDPDFVVVDVQDVTAAAPTGPGRQLDVEELLVVQSGIERKFAEVSRVLVSRSQAESASFLSVFVPLHGDRADREKQRKAAARAVVGSLRKAKGGR
ncbi:MAG: HD domain-containing protein [Armatimonadetes bacterium]|nr:HD domain-containing protein [Armatimonadota bacterium]